jgi:hypothetical protein
LRITSGIGPYNWFLEMSKYLKPLREDKEDGIVPLKEFPSKWRYSKLIHSPMVPGNDSLRHLINWYFLAYPLLLVSYHSNEFCDNL